MATERKPEHQDHPDGEVVYRRLAPSQDSAAARAAVPRFDPTLTPLLIGFAVLLLLVALIGNLSVGRLEDTSRSAFDLEHQFAARAMVMLQLRVGLNRLDNEARDRMEADARHELKPIFDLRLDTARGKVNNLRSQLDHAPLFELPKWRTFRDDLASYVETTKDLSRYSQEGFTKFRDVDAELDDIINDLSLEQAKIFERNEAMQTSATRSIRLWNLSAIFIGLVVAAGTIWQVQKRFRQTRQSTEAARREREFNTQMLEGMVSAIAAIDRHDRIRSANTAFFRIFPHASIGASIHNQMASTEAVKLLEAATASHVETSIYRGRWNLNDGEAHTFDVYSSPLEIDNEHGQILTLVDVTEAVKTEGALRRSESLAAVGEAAAQLAHEIKNPLGSIRLGIEMLRNHAGNEEAVKTISLVERGIQHLNKLVVDVTQFSRHRRLERSEVELHDVIDASIELVADRIREKETPIKKNFAADEIHGKWDGNQLREVFVNLLANAIDASPPKSPLKISTELVAIGSDIKSVQSISGAKADRVRILVTDYGSGMDAKTQARLFKPFFTTKRRGTGLGLSIVRQIIERHEGTIQVQSEPGEGTTFQIELPLTEAESERGAVDRP